MLWRTGSAVAAQLMNYFCACGQNLKPEGVLVKSWHAEERHCFVSAGASRTAQQASTTRFNKLKRYVRGILAQYGPMTPTHVNTDCKCLTPQFEG